MKKLSFVLVALIAPLIFYSWLETPKPLALALITSTVILWFSEWIPLSVTGLMVPLLATIYGVLPLTKAFSVFGNPILFLFLGSFLLARSMEKHGWDKRLIFYLLSRASITKSLRRVQFVFFFLSWFLSFWISNTAACAVLAPLAVGLGHSLKTFIPNERDYKNFMTSLLLGVAFSASIGGIVTPIGSPPNLLAIHFLAEKGIEIKFLEWVLKALPISLGMLVMLSILLKLRYKIPEIKTSYLKEHFTQKLKNLNSIKISELQVAVVFLLAVLLWLLPGLFKMMFPESVFNHFLKIHLPMSVVGLIAGVVLFVLPIKNEQMNWTTNLEKEDLLKVSWDTLLIFAGGLCIGLIMNESGWAQKLGLALVSIAGSEAILLLGALIILLAVLLSELGSNTASASLLIPIVLEQKDLLSIGSGSIENLIFMTALGASFGFMLPVSTPPNAIVYGTGEIEITEMKSTGVYFDVLGYWVILISFWIFL